MDIKKRACKHALLNYLFLIIGLNSENIYGFTIVQPSLPKITSSPFPLGV